MVARGPTTIESTLLENFDMLTGSFVETESPKVQKSSHLNQTLARLRRKTAKKFFWHLRPYPHFFLLYSTSLKAKIEILAAKNAKKILILRFCVLVAGNVGIVLSFVSITSSNPPRTKSDGDNRRVWIYAQTIG